MSGVVLALLGCVRSGPPAAAGDEVHAERRPFAPMVDGTPVTRGISYGPFRRGQAPGGPNPSEAEILQDLQIIAERWSMIRTYGAGEPTETIIRTIRDHDLPLVIMVGAWIQPEDAAEREREVADAIRLANAYPEQVVAVSIGNESQVSWSGHRTERSTLIGHLRAARQAVRQPVTTADDYNFWNKPQSHEVADLVDFVVLHAYAMWNGKSLDEAVSWTADTYATIAAEHPGHQVVIGETGWATEMNPEGDEAQHILAPAGTAEQERFYDELTEWAADSDVVYFYFEAFDEPWKGSEDPREVEKHWGLFDVDRRPKPALR